MFIFNMQCVNLYYGNYHKCKSILNRYKKTEIELTLNSKSDNYYKLELFSNVKKLTVNCNIDEIHLKCKTDQLVYMRIIRNFPSLPSMNSLIELYCDNTSIEFIPTYVNLKYLKTNCVTKIQYQPNLEELNVGYNTMLTILPYTPMLKTLICNDTSIENIPNYEHLEFLVCFNTTIKNIPKSVCDTLQRCFTSYKPIFESKPNMIESYNSEEDVHYLVPDEKKCMSYNDYI